MSDETNRREFEEWARPRNYTMLRQQGDYESNYTQNAWEAWQAARERQDKDSQRLDWLQSNQKTVWRVSHEERRLTTMLIPATTTVQVFDGWTVDDEENPKQTIREAIDQAMNPSDTPRTDAQATGNSDPQQDEYEDLLYFTRTLERELTAARAELKAVTEQRDGLQSDIDYASDQLHKVTEQIESNHKSYERIIYDVREQRDMLVEALKEYREALSNGPENCSYKMYEAVDEFAEKALASVQDEQ